MLARPNRTASLDNLSQSRRAERIYARGKSESGSNRLARGPARVRCHARSPAGKAHTCQCISRQSEGAPSAFEWINLH